MSTKMQAHIINTFKALRAAVKPSHSYINSHNDVIRYHFNGCIILIEME